MVCSQSATLISIALLQTWCVQKKQKKTAASFTVGLLLSLVACRWEEAHRLEFESERQKISLSMRHIEVHTFSVSVLPPSCCPVLER